MNSIIKLVAAVVSGLVATTGVAFAAPNFVPEPGTVALVALGVAGALLFSRKGRK
jgi:PEP-CTERM motif